MKEFKKVTEYDLEDFAGNPRKWLDERTLMFYNGNLATDETEYQYSLIDCESPIEQMLSLELANLRLEYISSFNPYIDVIAIEKQQEITIKGKKYRVDFLIPVQYKNQENIFFAIECDGHEFHQKTKEQVEKDNKRQRDLQEAGYEVIRFSGTEIYHRAYKCAIEVKNIILSKCKYIKDE